MCPLMRHEREIRLELDCLSNTEIFLEVAKGKILQSPSKCLGCYSTISQLDQQFINQNLGFMCEKSLGFVVQSFCTTSRFSADKIPACVLKKKLAQ